MKINLAYSMNALLCVRLCVCSFWSRFRINRYNFQKYIRYTKCSIKNKILTSSGVTRGRTPIRIDHPLWMLSWIRLQVEYKSLGGRPSCLHETNMLPWGTPPHICKVWLGFWRWCDSSQSRLGANALRWLKNKNKTIIKFRNINDATSI